MCLLLCADIQCGFSNLQGPLHTTHTTSQSVPWISALTSMYVRSVAFAWGHPRLGALWRPAVPMHTINQPYSLPLGFIGLQRMGTSPLLWSNSQLPSEPILPLEKVMLLGAGGNAPSGPIILPTCKSLVFLSQKSSFDPLLSTGGEVISRSSSRSFAFHYTIVFELEEQRIWCAHALGSQTLENGRPEI